ncbi:MAG: peptide/nickel transport system substrate-binding protein [Thermomicrobiales bacterium]|nr:peptide/nickel transport system substrate-binding protein [Thermomicrobiales bacterium]MEA2527042.1 peptide/nickel transport system substrate-binding protein [Thermomicrobiales bacterium]MEA2596687.1 peptide/nickel transport system substrate-binding protein [Thermomicrobiales bacterium]
MDNIARLIEEFRTGQVSRRAFLRRGAALGLSASLLGTLAGRGGALAAPGAQSPRAVSRRQQAGGQLVFGAWQDPDTLDPHTTGLAATSRILIHILDPLVWRNPADGQFYPGLAERWEVSPDGLTYTFYLRKDVVFHNGEPFTANSVKFTYDRIADPATKSLGRAQIGPYDHTEIVDDYTAKVVLTEPFSPFLTYGSVTIGARPVSPKAYQELGDEINVHPVGTGPFMYKEYVKQDHFTMVRNPDYKWGPSFFAHQDAAYLDEILWKIIPEPSTRVSALDNGEVMAIEEVRPQDVVRYKEDGNYQVLSSGTPGQPRMILVNTQKAPTDDVAVRRACLLATDQDTIITTLYKGVYTPSHSLLDPLTPGYAADLDGYVKFDLEKANQTLEEAGWVKNGDIREKDGQKLEILFLSNTANDFKNIAELMQATYREVGIDMKIEFESQPSVFSTYQKGPQNFADFFFWSPDPDQLSATYHSRNIESGFNWSHFNNPDFDALVDQAAREGDETKRYDLYRQAQVILWDQAASIPIQQKAALVVAQSKLKGVVFDGNAYPYYYDTTIE